MTITVDAIYENGMLKPVKPLPLEEHEKVTLNIYPAISLADVAHRVMTIEAMVRSSWPAAGLAGRLKKHHAEIPKLNLYQQATVKVGQLGIRVLPVSGPLVLVANGFSQQFELLTGDALVV